MQDPIAVVGLGCCFPSAPDPSSFWRLLASRGSAISAANPAQWDHKAEQLLGDGADRVQHLQMAQVAYQPSWPGDPGLPDALIRAEDPLLGMLLHAGWQAWLDAKLSGSDTTATGLLMGQIALPNEACSRLAEEWLLPAQPHSGYAASARQVTGRPVSLLARALQLGGVVRSLDAACASGLYAIELACAELRAGRMDCMLAGGASRADALYTQMGFQALGALSRSGHCRPFDAAADGLIVGQGAGILVLKRLVDAQAAGDRIYAVIHGCGLSNDIGGSLFGPDSEGQVRAMRAAYELVGWEPGSVSLVECHGTGTPKGDAVELASLRRVWNDAPLPVIGSVKANIGHLLTGAGAAAAIKTVLALHHRRLPPATGVQQAADGAAGFRLLDQPEAWQDPQPRAAISAFGFGGINAHMLLAAAPRQAPAPQPRPAPEPIAIVGMDAWVGPWRGLEVLGPRLLGGGEAMPPRPPAGWWPELRPEDHAGWFCGAIELPLDRFRIPPTEMRDMSRQQALMLSVAAGAFDDAGLGDDPERHERWGACLGIDQDLAATRFHLRWRLRAHGADPEQAAPPLTANRVMGNLGGIVASRVARAFRLGGPSFVLGDEDGSGLQALASAVELLRTGRLDVALVGAVSVQADPRHLLGRSHAVPPSEGAIALVCKRLADAEAADDRIYAVIEAGVNSSGADAMQRAAQALGPGPSFAPELPSSGPWTVQPHHARVGHCGAA
ncbi:MAG: beta-ketoacyl synthase N-terminal-like domain-containing protein, partial [Planctomycetota bacterium]